MLRIMSPQESVDWMNGLDEWWSYLDYNTKNKIREALTSYQTWLNGKAVQGLPQEGVHYDSIQHRWEVDDPSRDQAPSYKKPEVDPIFSSDLYETLAKIVDQREERNIYEIVKDANRRRKVRRSFLQEVQNL